MRAPQSEDSGGGRRRGLYNRECVRGKEPAGSGTAEAVEACEERRPTRRGVSWLRLNNAEHCFVCGRGSGSRSPSSTLSHQGRDPVPAPRPSLLGMDPARSWRLGRLACAQSRRVAGQPAPPGWSVECDSLAVCAAPELGGRARLAPERQGTRPLGRMRWCAVACTRACGGVCDRLREGCWVDVRG